jgi:hypothetical protein
LLNDNGCHWPDTVGSLLAMYSGSIQTNLARPAEMIEFAARHRNLRRHIRQQSIEYFTRMPGCHRAEAGRDAHPRSVVPPALDAACLRQIRRSDRADCSADDGRHLYSGADLDCTNTSTLWSAGDALFSLARRYGATVEDLQRANNLTDDNIYVGQQLIIPVP